MPSTLYDTAVDAFNAQNYPSAIKDLKKYIESIQNNPDEVVSYSDAFDLLGQCYEGVQDTPKALTCYATATNINRQNTSAWHNSGLFYIKLAEQNSPANHSNRLKLFENARVCLNNASALCNTNPMFFHSVACWYEKYIDLLKHQITNIEELNTKTITHFETAISHYQKALNACHENDRRFKNIITSNLTECIAQFGHHFYQDGNFSKARPLYFQALALDSEHTIVISQIGMTFYKEQCFSKARTYFLQILNKTTDAQELADAWLNTACTYRMEQSWIKAGDALVKAKQLAPEDQAIDNEMRNLKDAQATSSLINSVQTLFIASTPSSPSPTNGPENSLFQFGN